MEPADPRAPYLLAPDAQMACYLPWVNVCVVLQYVRSFPWSRGAWPEGRETPGPRSHRAVAVSDWFLRMGHAHDITLEDSSLSGGADPQGDDAAVGF